MAKNPEAERQSVVELVTLLLQERDRRLNNNTYTKENNNHIRYVLSHALLWKYTEAEGHKYKKCRYWSEGAIKSFERYGDAITSKHVCGGDALQHEHLFPLKQLINKLFSINNPTETTVMELLSKLNIAVIVTVDEHKFLHKIEGDENNPWTRYEKAGIKVEKRF